MVNVLMFQTHSESQLFEQAFCEKAISLTMIEPRLTAETAPLSKGYDAVISFVNDSVDRAAIEELANNKIKLIALRCAGFNHVDVAYAESLGIKIVRVPAYSPHAVAEHTVALLLALNRKLHKAFFRVQSLNFSLEGLVGFDLYGKTVGVIGTGKIGVKFAKIMMGFGCNVLACDISPNLSLGSSCTYCELEYLLTKSDIISLHVPLTPQTQQLINKKSLSMTKKGVIILNTSRGGLIDSRALIEGLKSGHIGGAGLDVYEEEEGVFFQDLSDSVLKDDILARLLTFPNTIITSHQAFLTKEALEQIANTTFANINDYFSSGKLRNEVNSQMIK